MDIRVQIKEYFQKKDYENIKRIILFYPEVLNELTQEEINALLKYGIEEGERILLFSLFNYVEKKDRFKIIKSFPYSLIQQRELETNFKETVEEYIDAFLEIGFKKEGHSILYVLSKIIAKNPEKYREERERIQEYLKEVPLDETIVSIAALPSFANEEILKRIIKTGNPNYIIRILENQGEEEMQKGLIELFKNIPKVECIQELAIHTKKYEAIGKAIQECATLTKDQKSIYYTTVLKLIKDPSLKQVWFQKILSLGNYFSIAESIKTFTTEEQEKIAQEYLKSKDLTSIFYLACTTNCPSTYHLIDQTLEQDKIELFLYLKDPYLNYALMKIISKSKEQYLEILEFYQKIGTSDSDRLVDDMIHLIQDLSLESSFPKSALKREKRNHKIS